MSFKKPDLEQDSKFIKDEASRTGGGESMYETQYKPKPGTKREQRNNKVRILGARAESEGTYYLRIGRHFIKHNDRTEMFICPKETSGDPCPSCETYVELKAKGDKSADKYRAQIRGVFNVLDRDLDMETAKVQVYFAPIQAICSRIVNLVYGQGPMSDVFDEFDDKFAITKPGRDWILIYNEKADPADMYMIYPIDMSPMGTPDQVKRWCSEIRDLTVKGLFGKLISYEDAATKTFGTPEERQALRDRWQQEAQAREAARTEEPKSVEEPKSEPKVEEPKVEPKAEEKPVEEKPKEEPKKEEPKVEKTEAELDVAAKIKAKVEAAKAAATAAK